jgi:hypothetical protein
MLQVKLVDRMLNGLTMNAPAMDEVVSDGRMIEGLAEVK